jgi:predicted O-linked N-acetylglucosamine transferase (SPINDLY family)
MSEALLQDARRAHALGHLSDAARLYAQALRADSRNFEALLALGVLNYDRGNHEDARRLLAEAVKFDPGSAAAHFAHGCALQALHRNGEALDAFEAARARDPQHAETHLRRANILLILRRYREAVKAYDDYLAHHRDFAQGWHNRGVALSALRRFSDAAASFSEAIALRPDSAQSWHNRGLVHSELKDLESAIRDHARALDLVPDLADARGHLVFAKLAACDWRGLDEERAKLGASIRADLPAIVPFGNIMVSDSPADQMRPTRLWMARYANAPPPLWRGERYDHARIRIAYVSGDFRVHPVGILMAGVFEHHDRQNFETIGISFGPDDASAIRARIAGSFEHFVDARAKSDFEVAAHLREMQADIVIDLMGPTADCRSAIFAARPGPVQVNYLGYPGTMACGFMDYILADRVVIPEGDERHYSEKIVYLPGSYLASDDKRAIARRTPSRAELGLPETGIVFCSFNSAYKFTPEVYSVWMRILRSVPGSILWLPAGNPAMERNLKREADTRGVAPDRILFARYLEQAEDHLARLGAADLFLDTLPCNAHTTASDALWAGLPVLTCKGTSFAGRVAASLSYAAGLPELVTDSLADYEAQAVSLAQNPEQLRTIKARLASRRRTAALFDTARITRNLEAAYTQMRARSLRGEAPQSFSVESVS